MPPAIPAPYEDWTDDELRLIVDDYFQMLEKELAGERYVKAEHARNLSVKLPARTHGAIEFKHQNISAALEELGLDYIDGYKPRRNYQLALLQMLYERTRTAQHDLQQALFAPSQRRPEPWSPIDPATVLVAPPPSVPETQRVPQAEVERWSIRMASLVDWSERDARLRALGRAGEEFVVRFEQARLHQASRGDLAQRVRHVAQLDGDGLGYDILSFEPDGRKRLIEVKTTVSGPAAPFVVTRREVDASSKHRTEFVLARVFRFRTHARLFELRGSIAEHCHLEPASYLARAC